VDLCIHCAALLTPHIGLHSESEFWQVNVKGTENLLEACLKHNAKRFVFTSSTSASRTELEGLKKNADQVILRHFPWVGEEFLKRRWSLPKTIDRVYVIEKATKLLGYHPSHNFTEWFAEKNF
jgi:thioester reductase-like protein